jgi:ribosomal protein S18 acetylase RimI-like enzyme
VHTASWQAGYAGILSADYLSGLDWRFRAEWWASALGSVDGVRVTLVAVDDRGTVRGFTRGGPSRDEDAEPGTAEVYAIYVDPRSWRLGVGGRLLAEVLARLDARSTSLWVLEENAAARRFYAGHGFLPDGVRKPDSIGGVEVVEVRLVRQT